MRRPSQREPKTSMAIVWGQKIYNILSCLLLDNEHKWPFFCCVECKKETNTQHARLCCCAKCYGNFTNRFKNLFIVFHPPLCSGNKQASSTKDSVISGSTAVQNKVGILFFFTVKTDISQG